MSNDHNNSEWYGLIAVGVVVGMVIGAFVVMSMM